MLSQFQALLSHAEGNDRHGYLWTLTNILRLVFNMANEAGLESVLSAAYHWEDQFCRDVYQNLCVYAEFQHLRATALLSPGTTPRVCPVDNLMNTHPSPPLGDQATMYTLDPCAWRYVLTMDDLASFRLKTRSDVVGTWVKTIIQVVFSHTWNWEIVP